MPTDVRCLAVSDSSTPVPISRSAVVHLTSCAVVQLLAMKKSPDDILKLFNQQPQNALFAGSPAQACSCYLL